MVPVTNLLALSAKWGPSPLNAAAVRLADTALPSHETYRYDIHRLLHGQTQYLDDCLDEIFERIATLQRRIADKSCS